MFSASIINASLLSMMLFLCRSAAFIQNNNHHQLRVLSRFLTQGIVPLSSSSSSVDEHTHNKEDSLYASLYGNTLVSIQDCINAQRLTQTYSHHDPKIIFIDASWYHRPDPTTNQFRGPSAEYIQGPRLPLARYIDIDAVATTHELFPMDNPNILPHMFPPPSLFGMAMDAYNIRNEDHVVIYAKRGAVFTPRMWFLFLSMGHDENRVHLLQGSLEDYIELSGGESVEEYSLTDENKDVRIESFYDEEYAEYFHDGILNVTKLYHAFHSTTSRYKVNVSQARHICDKEEVLRAVKSNMECMASNSNVVDDSDTIILDTRGSSYAKGHMPSAIHLPYAQLVDPNNSLILKPTTEIKQMFEDRGIDYLNPKKKIILSCGSGVSVCHGYLALKQLGREMTEENTRIYDGSWTEWKTYPDLPKVSS